MKIILLGLILFNLIILIGSIRLYLSFRKRWKKWNKWEKEYIKELEISDFKIDNLETENKELKEKIDELENYIENGLPF